MDSTWVLYIVVGIGVLLLFLSPLLIGIAHETRLLKNGHCGVPWRSYWHPTSNWGPHNELVCSRCGKRVELWWAGPKIVKKYTRIKNV